MGLAWGLWAHDDDGPTAGKGAEYVALGDSYSSGTGTAKAEGKCLRSPGAYGALYARMHPEWSFRLEACSGANSSQIRVRQLDEVTERARLVTVTAGGNDGRSFAAVLTACAVVHTDTGCDEALGTADVYREEYLPGALRGLYAAITDRAPRAQVRVLGYPRLFDAGEGERRTCEGAPAVEVQEKLDEFSDRLNRTVRTVAREAGVRFTAVDFAGHGVCSDEPWVRGFEKGAPLVQAFHPNDAGHARGYLSALAGGDIGGPGE